MFVTESLVQVVDNPGAAPGEQNTISLRERLTLGQDAALRGDLLRQQRELGGSHLSAAQWQSILLTHHAAGWSGPAFRADGQPIPCTRETILQLDPAQPLVKMALERVWTLHFPPSSDADEDADEDDADPKAPPTPPTSD